METNILVKYNEIWLKGRKRAQFENKLIEGIKHQLSFQHHPHTNIIKKGARIIIFTSRPADLSHLAGIASYCFSFSVQPEERRMESLIESVFLAKLASPFCVRVKRHDKCGQSSKERECSLGSFICRKTGFKVNLKHPRSILFVEIYKEVAFLYTEEKKGLGGLPQQEEGRIALILETEKDLQAGISLIKRGCIPEVITTNEGLFTRLQYFCQHRPLQKINKEKADTYPFIAAGEEHPKMTPLFLLPLEGLYDGEAVEGIIKCNV